MSAPLIPAARTCTSTRPSPGSGSGSSTTSIDPPETTAARMSGPRRADEGPDAAERRPAAEDHVQRLAQELEPRGGRLGGGGRAVDLRRAADPAEDRIRIRGQEFVPLVDLCLDRALADVVDREARGAQRVEVVV